MTLPRNRVAAVLLLLVTVLLLGVPAAAAQVTVVTSDAASEPPVPQGYSCADPANWDKPGCKVRDTGVGPVGRLVGAGLSSVFDGLYEWVASGATWLLGRLAGLIDSSTRPQVDAGWFARQYQLMATLAAALVTPLLLIATLSAVVRSDWRGLVRSYLLYLPAAMVGAAVAVPLVDLALDLTDWMSSLFLDGLRGDVDAFTAQVSDTLTAATGAGVAGGGVAPFLLFLGAAVVALGAFAVWVELVLRAAGIYVALFFLPLGFAALVWPSTRGWFARLVKALAALILSKFVIVAVIALAAGALGDLDDGSGGGFSGVIAGAALMLMAAFSPVVLFRLADVAGDEMAAAIGSVTQQRTSPVPTPSPTLSAAAVYGRIMHNRGATAIRTPSTGSPAGAAADDGGGAGGAAPTVEPAGDRQPAMQPGATGDTTAVADGTQTTQPGAAAPDATDDPAAIHPPASAAETHSAAPVNWPTQTPPPAPHRSAEAPQPLSRQKPEAPSQVPGGSVRAPAPVPDHPTEGSPQWSDRPVPTPPTPAQQPADRPWVPPPEPPSTPSQED